LRKTFQHFKKSGIHSVGPQSASYNRRRKVE